jgi:hypothetical protein
VSGRARLLLAALAALAVLAGAAVLLAVRAGQPHHPRTPASAAAPPSSSGTRTDARPPAPALAVFSDLCVHAGGGEVDGLRIVVTAGDGEPRVLGQYAADGRLPPLGPAASVLKDGRLSFRLPGASPGQAFTGVIAGGRARVRSSTPGAEPFELPPAGAADEIPLCG